MNKKNYQKLYHFFSRHSTAGLWLKRLNILTTLPAFVLYPLLLVRLFMKKDRGFISYLTVPGIAFLSVSVFRRIINRKRPYETYGIPSLISKDKTGHSFPSRHVFSSFLIAVLWIPVHFGTGVSLMATSIVVALVRVLGGVHYISDVLVGAIAGILSGFISILIRKI